MISEQALTGSALAKLSDEQLRLDVRDGGRDS